MAKTSPEIVLLMGPPGAGKGTQAVKLARVKRGTELGQQAKAIMDVGQLVSDDIVIGMVRAEIVGMNPVRVLFDGFPRTPAQADALDNLLKEFNAGMTGVILLEVNEDELVERLLERAQKEGRSDDSEEVIRERMKVYKSSTQPVVDYYEKRSKLRQVDGIGTVEEVFARISEVLP
jgi:adenylate kinase